MGNPTIPKLDRSPEDLSNLPGAEREAAAIAQLLSAPALTGDEASETVVKSRISQAGLIHFATHGLLSYEGEQGIPGAKAKAPSPQDDGFLTAEEILPLKLQAELVVLSACDTGRGRITSDGIIGLSRAFIGAGTPSLIVSALGDPRRADGEFDGGVLSPVSRDGE